MYPSARVIWQWQQQEKPTQRAELQEVEKMGKKKMDATATSDIVTQATKRLVELCRNDQPHDLIPSCVRGAPRQVNNSAEGKVLEVGEVPVADPIPFAEAASNVVLQASQNLQELKKQLDSLPAFSEQRKHVAKEIEAQKYWRRSLAELISSDPELDCSSNIAGTPEVACELTAEKTLRGIGGENQEMLPKMSIGMAPGACFELKPAERLGVGNSSNSSIHSSAVVSQIIVDPVSPCSPRCPQKGDETGSAGGGSVDVEMAELLEDALKKIRCLQGQNQNLREEMQMRDSHIQDLEQLVGEQQRALHGHREVQSNTTAAPTTAETTTAAPTTAAPRSSSPARFGEEDGRENKTLSEDDVCLVTLETINKIPERPRGTCEYFNLTPERPGHQAKASNQHGLELDNWPTLKTLAKAWERRQDLPGQRAPDASDTKSKGGSPSHLALAWHVERLNAEIARKDQVLDSKDRALRQRQKELAERVHQVEELQLFMHKIHERIPAGVSPGESPLTAFRSLGRGTDPGVSPGESPLTSFRSLSRGRWECAPMNNDSVCDVSFSDGILFPCQEELDEPKPDVLSRREPSAMSSSSDSNIPPVRPQLVAHERHQAHEIPVGKVLQYLPAEDQPAPEVQTQPFEQEHSCPSKELNVKKSKQHHVIAVDLDDVCCSFVNNFRQWFLHEYMHERPNRSPSGCRTGQDSDALCEFFLRSASAANPEYVPGAVEGLRRLKAAGLSLELITSRPECFRVATEQMVQQNFPGIFDRLHFTYHKWSVCHRIGARVLIDDSVRQVKEAASVGVNAVLFDLGNSYSWNQGFGAHGVVRCCSWKSTVDWILNFIGQDLENASCGTMEELQASQELMSSWHSRKMSPRSSLYASCSTMEELRQASSSQSSEELPRSPHSLPRTPRMEKQILTASDLQQELLRLQSVIKCTSAEARQQQASLDHCAAPSLQQPEFANNQAPRKQPKIDRDFFEKHMSWIAAPPNR